MGTVSMPLALLFFLTGVVAAHGAGGDDPDMSIISYGERHGMRELERGEAKMWEIYERWIERHGRSYNALDEKERRFEVFKDNIRYIDEHNAAADAGVHSFRLGLNRFADLTNEEYRASYLGTRQPLRRRNPSNRYRLASGEALPDSVDWRTKGAVVRVKDQGTCGIFYQFSFLFLMSFIIIDIHRNWWDFRLVGWPFMTIFFSKGAAGLFRALRPWKGSTRF